MNDVSVPFVWNLIACSCDWVVTAAELTYTIVFGTPVCGVLTESTYALANL